MEYTHEDLFLDIYLTFSEFTHIVAMVTTWWLLLNKTTF